VFKLGLLGGERTVPSEGDWNGQIQETEASFIVPSESPLGNKSIEFRTKGGGTRTARKRAGTGKDESGNHKYPLSNR